MGFFEDNNAEQLVSKQGISEFEQEVEGTQAKINLAKPIVEFTEEQQKAYPALYELNKGASFTAKMALGFVPFLRFAIPAEREAFKYMDFGDKVSSLAWEGFGLTLLGGPSAFRLAKKAWGVASTMSKTPIPLLSRKAAEDTWKFFSQQKAREGVLARQFRFKGGERKAVVSYVKGDLGALTKYEMDHTIRGGTFSKSWEKHTGRQSGVPYAQRVPTAEVISSIEKAQTPTLRHLYFQRQWFKGMREAGFLGETPKFEWADVAFKKMADRAGSVSTLADAKEIEVASFFKQMLDEPQHVKNILTPGGFWPAMISPFRVAFGKMDKYWGSYSEVFERVRDSFHASRRGTADFFYEGFRMLERRGIGKLNKNVKTGEVGFSFNDNYRGDAFKAAFTLLKGSEEIMKEAGERAARTAPRAAGQILGNARRKAAALLQDPIYQKKEVQDLFFAWKDYSDYLYGTRSMWRFGKALDDLPIDYTNPVAQFRMETIRKQAMGVFEKYFISPMMGGRPFSPAEKIKAVQTVLDEGIWKSLKLTSLFELPGKTGIAKDKAIEGIYRKLQTQLSIAKNPRDPGMWVPYRDGYSEVISTRQRGLEINLLSELVGGGTTFYKELRQLPGLTPPINDLNSLFVINSRQLAKEMFLYEDLEKSMKAAMGMPRFIREATEHLIARTLNIPSRVDASLANWSTRTVGVLSQKVKQLVGKGGPAKPPWDVQDARTVNDFVQGVNDYAYMSAFGFRPFSSARNMFQTPINVPADLGGGFTGMYHTAMGLLKQFSTKPIRVGTKVLPNGQVVDNMMAEGTAMRKYIRDIGGITEYAPEIFTKEGFIPKNKEFMVGGKLIRLPRRDKVRDFLTAPFRASDRGNRYITGAAAASKWDSTIEKLGGLAANNVDEFAKKVGIPLRQEWVSKSLMQHLRDGNYKGAKDAFVLDVIADTQYLYGVIDAPYASGKLGAVGRAGIVFQSWFMNYGSQIEKWLRTGEASDKVQRMATWLFTGFVIDEIATEFWGEGAADRMTLLGPFPREFQIPPAFAPVWHGTRMFLDGLDAAMGRDPARMEEAARRFIDSFVIFIPMGLQGKQWYMGGKKEGLEGVLKGTLKIKPPGEDYRGFMFGAFK